MSFITGFNKTASLTAGLSEAAKQTVGDVMKLKGLRESVSETTKAYGGQYKNLFKTELGRAHLAKAVGKSAPSAVVGAGYAAGFHGVNKKLSDKKKERQQNYYQ